MIASIQHFFSNAVPSCFLKSDVRVARLADKALLTPFELDHQIKIASHAHQSLEKKWRYAALEMAEEKDNANFEFTLQHVPIFVERGKIGPYPFGACHDIGRRGEMEDEHLAAEITVSIGSVSHAAQVFGVFDGHGGDLASAFVKQNLAAVLRSQLEKHGLTEEGIWNALKMTFVILHDAFSPCGKQAEILGTTAVVALVLDGKLWIANVGDSRAVLDSNGKFMQLSEDMKPGTLYHPSRVTQRIVNRGGLPIPGFPPRVNGTLAVGGAIGDHNVTGISPRPAITCTPLSSLSTQSRLVLACDGIFDVASTRQVLQGVYQHRNRTCGKLAQAIVVSAFKSGSMDNLSALVVRLK